MGVFLMLKHYSEQKQNNTKSPVSQQSQYLKTQQSSKYKTIKNVEKP